MARARKPAGSRRAEKIVYVVCEGAKDKSENAYFKALVKSRRFPGSKVSVQVVETSKTSARELVAEAKKARELDQDEAWAVFDKDGYTLHAEAFEHARQSDVNIAFSSISFEYWILLHFERTSRAFDKSEKVIKYMKDRGYINYSKASRSVFVQTEGKLAAAIANAKWIQEYQRKSSAAGAKIYNFNPYTDVNVLVETILEMSESL